RLVDPGLATRLGGGTPYRGAAQEARTQRVPDAARPGHPRQRGPDRSPGRRPDGSVRGRLGEVGQAPSRTGAVAPQAVPWTVQPETPARRGPLGGGPGQPADIRGTRPRDHRRTVP